MQDIRPVDLSAYSTAADLASIALLVDGKIDIAGDTEIGNLWFGDDSITPPTGSATRYLIISGAATSAIDYGGLILQGSGGGNSNCGEIIFAGNTRRYGRILSRAVNGNPATGTLTFYVDVSGTEVTGMAISGAGVVDFGGSTGTAAAFVTANNYSFSGQTYSIGVRNLGNSATNGAGIKFQATGSTGTIIDIGYVAVKKTAVTTTTSTADFIVSVPNASATPTEAMRVISNGFVNIVGGLRLGAYTAATLPSASTYDGYSARVTDSNVAAAGNYGATVAGGGSNKVSVFSNGTNWVIS
jgi:hypothetical protein